jgi:hypothetical protein
MRDLGTWPGAGRIAGTIIVAIGVAVGASRAHAQVVSGQSAPAAPTPAQTAPATPSPAQAAPATPAPTPPADKFSALVFGDYYYFAQDHDPNWEGENGFWLRRIYLTWDHTFSPTLVTRLRLEMNSNGQLKSGNITPYVKDAYLRWTYAGRQQVTLGIQPTPIIEFGDAFWGLRHIEKTPLDLYKWDSSRDFAVTASGPLDRAGRVKYTFQFGNESGTESELNSSKAIRSALRYDAGSGLTFQANVSRFHHVSHADWVTAHAQLGYRHARGRAGVEYAYQLREHGDFSTTPDVTQRVVSVFGVADPRPQKISAFARLDFYLDACPRCADLSYLPIDPGAPFTFGLAGVEFYIHPSVRFSPNVEWVAYGTPVSAGAAPLKNDIVFRTTFFWSW